MHTIRVDGNDILAVHEATAAARAVAITNNCPVLVEAMRCGRSKIRKRKKRRRAQRDRIGCCRPLGFSNQHPPPTPPLALQLPGGPPLDLG